MNAMSEYVATDGNYGLAGLITDLKKRKWSVAAVVAFFCLSGVIAGLLLPTIIVWLYAYSYFNVLNLENMITRSGAPFYDGSMWRQLLPSVLRPASVHASYLQLTSMNV